MTEAELLIYTALFQPDKFSMLYLTMRCPTSIDDLTILVRIYHSSDEPEDEKIWKIIEEKIYARYPLKPIKRGWFR